jgi:superfamily II DNA or RNA helicase
MTKYPDVNNKKFYQFVNKKYAKYKIPKKQKTFRQICFPNKYELQIPQQFLANFINPKTPYRGILVYHRIGAGKTCTAIRIAEQFRKIKKIMVVLPASLRGNFRSELRSPCAGNKYIKSYERQQLKQHHPSSKEYKEIIKKSDSRIDKYYDILSYNKFVGLIKKNSLNINNTLLIIDEVHNMISETGIYYELLYDVIRSAPNDLRLVIMSATPIFDKPIEIALTMNLLLTDKYLPIGRDFVNMFMDIKYSDKGPIYYVKNMDKFKRYIRGYVSYYRGAPPYVFPKSKLFFVRTKMSEPQKKLYLKIIFKEAKYLTSKVEDYVNTDISNSFFIGTRMVSNFYFPNGKLGKEGYDSLVDSDFRIVNIKEYSPKFIKIFRKIKKCEGTVFVYSNFKEHAGIHTFARFLEYHRFKNYEIHGPGDKRFAMWTGDQTSVLKEEIKAVFNNKDNINGTQIKVVLGSAAVKEGVSFLRVQEVHIMEPYWNWSRMAQIIGRAIRFCSHKDMPSEKQMVNVYIYLAVHPEIKRTIDQHIVQMALTKERVNKQFENALKEAAIDCELFKNANVYPSEEDIVCEN